jgi:hypothetical protein
LQLPTVRTKRFPLAPIAAALLLALGSACAGSPGGAAGPEPAETFPNLASVPDRPARPPPAERAARVAALEQDRAEAEARRSALAAAGLVAIGSVAPDPAGRFAAAEEGLLRRAAGASRIRLVGPAAAALATADRLTALGAARSRIELEAAPLAVASSSRVEILVASGPPGR